MAFTMAGVVDALAFDSEQCVTLRRRRRRRRRRRWWWWWHCGSNNAAQVQVEFREVFETEVRTPE